MANRDKPLHLLLFQGQKAGTETLETSSVSTTGAAAGGPEEIPALLQVGELAKATGKTVRAVHLYEELGLLRAHDRSKGRYRLFTEEALVRVRWITKLQSLGLSLTEIQELVKEQEASGSAQFAASRLRQVYGAKLEETRTKIAELKALQAELEDSLDYLAACNTACESELPVHACPTCERHPERPTAPDLVAGVHVN